MSGVSFRGGYKPPTVQDYDSDANDSPTGSGGRSPSKSNVAVKRSSHSSDLGKEKPRAGVHPDIASDSGYSSRTAATKSTSADSAQSSHDKARGSPLKTTAAPAPARATSTRRRQAPAILQEKKTRPHESPRKPERRQSTSQSRRPRQDSIVEPDRSKPHDYEDYKRPMPRLDTNLRPFISAQHSPQYPPPSPGYSQIEAHSDTTRPRLYPTGSRPVSYHGGSTYSDPYTYRSQVACYNGPPPAMYNHPVQYPVTGAMPQYPHGVPASPLMMHHPMDRPPIMSRATDGYGLRTPISGHELIIHQQGQQSFNNGQKQNLPDPRYGPTTTLFPRYEEDYPSDDPSYDEWNRQDEDRRRMPPPPPPRLEAPPKRRPSLRGKSRTTQSILTKKHLDEQYVEAEDDEDSRYQLAKIPSRDRSKRRSSLVVPERRRMYLPNSRDKAEVVVESPRLGRRSTYREHDEVKRNTTYNAAVPSRADKGAGKRRSTDVDSMMRDLRLHEQRKERDDRKVRGVEEYQKSMGGGHLNTIDALLTKKTRDPSETGRSRTSSDDRRSRVSDSQKSTTTRKTNDMKIHLDSRDGIALEFGDNMADKIIKLRSGDDGNQTIIIEDSGRQKERKYVTEGSRVTTATARVRARRDTDAGQSRVSNRSERDRGRDGNRNLELDRSERETRRRLREEQRRGVERI